MLTQHIVQFSSDPPGAVVTHRGKEIGTTPFAFDVRDEFGFFSRYEFTAKVPDRADVTLTYIESTVLHSQGIVPKELKFTFGEPKPAKP